MPPPPPYATKKLVKKAPSKSAPVTTDAVTDITQRMSSVAVRSPFIPYSFDSSDSFLIKEFTDLNINYVQIDFFSRLVMDNKAYEVELIEDGTAIKYKKVTPEMFGETKRLKQELDYWDAGG